MRFEVPLVLSQGEAPKAAPLPTLPGEPRNRRELGRWLSERAAAHKGNPPPLTPREYEMVNRIGSGANRPAYSLT